MKQFKLIILFLLLPMINIYGQKVIKLRIEHIGDIDKPFMVLELYSGEYYEQSAITGELLVIADSNVFHKSIKYFDSEFMGELEGTDLKSKYGTFSVSFFDNEYNERKVFLNREGAVYFFVNLYTFISSNEESKISISSMIRRLL